MWLYTISLRLKLQTSKTSGKNKKEIMLVFNVSTVVIRFYGKGHRVVGVEYIEEVARGFFVDNSLPFDEAECPVLKCKILQV